MSDLFDLKHSISIFTNSTPNNTNYLENLITSIQGSTLWDLPDIIFEIEINMIVVDEVIEDINRIYNISRVELPIFLSELNNMMGNFLGKGDWVRSELMEMLFIAYWLEMIYSYLEYDGVHLVEDVTREYLSPYLDYIYTLISDCMELTYVLLAYNNVLEVGRR